MREDDAGSSPAPERANPLLRRLANSRAPLLAPALLFAGALGGLAARRRKDDTGKGGGQDGNGDKNDGGGARDRRDGQGDQSRQDRDHSDRARGDHAGRDSNGNRHDRNHDGHHNGHHDQSDVVAAATKTPTPTATATPTPKNGGGGGGGGNGNGNDGGGNNDGGGGHAGNGGTDFFDSPLATKARRRAKFFDNNNDNRDDHGIVVDVNDSDHDSTFETDNISYTTGPDGIEVLTGNIDYSAVATQTPTPIPPLTLPTRESSVFTVLTPTAGTGVPAVPAPAPAPSNNVPSVAEPSNPQPDTPATVPTSTSGGDNSTIMMS